MGARICKTKLLVGRTKPILVEREGAWDSEHPNLEGRAGDVLLTPHDQENVVTSLLHLVADLSWGDKGRRKKECDYVLLSLGAAPVVVLCPGCPLFLCVRLML